MENLVFIFPIHIFTKHVYITYHIYRYKQCITNIKILRILITVTATGMILVINNNNKNNNNNNNNDNNNNYNKKIRKKRKIRRFPLRLRR